MRTAQIKRPKGIGLRYVNERKFAGSRNIFTVGFAPAQTRQSDDRFENVAGTAGTRTAKSVQPATSLDLYVENQHYVTVQTALVLGAQATRVSRKFFDEFLADGNNSFDVRYNQVSPKVGARYEFTPSVQVFTNWGVDLRFRGSCSVGRERGRPCAPSHRPQAGMQGVVSLDVYRDGDSLHLLTGENGSNDAAPAVIYRRSDDSGATWSKPVRVDQGKAASYGARRGNDYQVAASGNRVVAVWMTRGSGWGGSGPLATARSSDRGKNWTPNATLDDQTCECCWNSLLSTGAGIYGLYRDKSPRDMVLVNSPDSGKNWHRVATAGAFNWQIDACPEAGGALVVAPENALHAIVWTGREDAIGLYHLVSADQGRTCATPRRVGGEMARHVEMAVGRNGVIATVWDEWIKGEWTIMVSVSSENGSSGSAPRRLSDLRSQATHPRIVTTRRGFRVFWTEQEKDQLRVWKSASL